jgi:transcriptional regulator with XRE-family HTH domain
MIEIAMLGETFRDNVRRLMDECDPPMTPSVLARRMNVSPQYVNGYLTENGPRDPGLGVLARFAEALGTEPHELIRPAKVSA